jgi:hypothetical protein
MAGLRVSSPRCAPAEWWQKQLQYSGKSAFKSMKLAGLPPPSPVPLPLFPRRDRASGSHRAAVDLTEGAD